MNENVLVSGKTSFKIEVPYKLIESGEKGTKPLIVYLHGFGHTMQTFQENMADLLAVNAFHLFIQGPYPIYDRSREKRVEDWGRAWYLYDGRQDQFIKSLELTSEFIQEIIDGLLNHISVSRLCILGYSMGAYLAGYFALSRWRHVNDLVMIGGRLKTEVFEGRDHNYDHLRVLALHGSHDRRVEAEPQRKCVDRLGEWGAETTFKSVNAAHTLDSRYVEETMDWLQKYGYTKS